MKRGAGGFRAWVIQRLSAVYLALFLPAVFAGVMLCPPQDYAAWRALWAAPPLWIACGLFFISLLLHSWVGMRDVILDYVHPVALRLGMLTALGGGLMVLGLWALWILFSLVGTA